ncbi:Lysine-specific demethylase 5A [Cichlidogyrus casuarinus]|uniref:Lysine-specific demethylase 5A n=1 Tax=Cichlidogyrus casuarinus TaxID=1844966 RepID=A0ABD2Q5Y5_9PLAT
MFKKHYAGMISEELETMLSLRQSNAAKASEEVQDRVVYCLCRSPGFYGMMIQCELCKDWFHPKCVAFPMNNINPERLRYICPRCQRTQRPELSEILPLLQNLMCQLANILVEQQQQPAEQLKVEEEQQPNGMDNSEQLEVKSETSDEYFQYNGNSLTHNLLPMPELAAMQMVCERAFTFIRRVRNNIKNTPDLGDAIKRFEVCVRSRFPLQTIHDSTAIDTPARARWPTDSNLRYINSFKTNVAPSELFFGYSLPRECT